MAPGNITSIDVLYLHHKKKNESCSNSGQPSNRKPDERHKKNKNQASEYDDAIPTNVARQIAPERAQQNIADLINQDTTGTLNC